MLVYISVGGINVEIKDSKMKDFAQLIATTVATAVIETLEKGKYISHKEDTHKNNKSAYQKTEQLLYNYNGFKRIIKERELEIEEVLKHGVPQNRSVKEFVSKGGMPCGIRLEEETVEAYVANVQKSMTNTLSAINLIDNGLEKLKYDPYYMVLPMTYFEGRTQEDIADYIGCSQVSISKNKNRLVKALSLQLFPDQVITEMLG